MGTLAHLHETAEQLLQLDPNSLTDDELHDVVTELQAERSRLAIAAAQLVRQWDVRRVWALDRSASAAARLSRDTHTSLQSARTELRRARDVRRMPAAVAAIREGALSVDHLDLFARATPPHRRDHFARDEHGLVEQSKPLRFSQSCRVLAYWSQRVDAEVDDDPPPRLNKTEAHVSATYGGSVSVNAMLDPIGGEVFAAEVQRLEHELYLADTAAGVERTPAQRRAAAFVEMATRSRIAPADGRRPQPLFTVLVGDKTLEWLCELAGGTVLHPNELVPWLGTAMLETVLFAGPSTVVSVSKRRTFTGALRCARSRSGTGTVSTARAATSQRPSATSTTSCRTLSTDRRTSSTATWGCHRHNRDPLFHDPNGVPRPYRTVTRLDELRTKIRWRVQREYPEEFGDPPLADTG